MFKKALLEAAGTLRRSYEEVDWAATSLGPMASWSPTLISAVDLALHTRFPVTLLWGPEFVLLYNQAYVPMIADKHPAALGAPAREVFPEAWEKIGPMMQAVFAGQGSTWVEDAPVPLDRHGFLEEAYFTFSYSPVRAPGGVIEGVMDIASETSRHVIDRRRLLMLSHLREVLGDLERVDELAQRALPVLRGNAADLPAVDIEPAAVGGALRDGVARFPLGSTRSATLTVRLSEHLAPDGDYLAFLRLIASSLGQAIDRLRVHEAERGIAEALQRSLLTEPPERDHMQVAVRYLPAAEQARVGGDWYDAFTGVDGALTLVVGDVTGHDQHAAAAMAQIRNLVRGISHTMQAWPSRVLDALDGAMDSLAVGVYATAIVARVERDRLRWSNAGHLPPVLVAPDGAARLLETTPNPLLGLGAGAERDDHALELEPGATVVFYTDGLVERRKIPLQDRLEWLAQLLAGRHTMSAEAICDLLLAETADTVDDDVALLVLRIER